MTQPSPEEIIALLHEFPITEIEIEQDGFRIKAAVVSPGHPEVRASLSESDPVENREDSEPDKSPADTSILITADMVGHFHLPSPPLRYGVEVHAGQIVGNIESIKVMNEVVSEIDGRLAETLVDDGAPVEYGQPLYRLAPV